MEFPKVYINDEGAELVALNDIQAAVFEREGFKPVEEAPAKKGK